MKTKIICHLNFKCFENFKFSFSIDPQMAPSMLADHVVM